MVGYIFINNKSEYYQQKTKAMQLNLDGFMETAGIDFARFWWMRRTCLSECLFFPRNETFQA